MTCHRNRVCPGWTQLLLPLRGEGGLAKRGRRRMLRIRLGMRGGRAKRDGFEPFCSAPCECAQSIFAPRMSECAEQISATFKAVSLRSTPLICHASRDIFPRKREEGAHLIFAPHSFTPFSSASTAGRIFATIFSTPSWVGCNPSFWLSFGSAATPSRKNG